MVRYIHTMTDWAKTQLYKMEEGKKHTNKQIKTILHFLPNNILKLHVFVV